MKSKVPCCVFWFRRDLRLTDNCGLNAALSSGLPVLPLFIFDSNILDKLKDKKDARVEFIHQRIEQLQGLLRDRGSDILVLKGDPQTVWKKIISEYNVQKVFFNRDYEPYARKRDEAITKICTKKEIEVSSFKDQVIFEPGEVLKKDGNPYVVYTPYKNQCLKQMSPDYLGEYPSQKKLKKLLPIKCMNVPSLSSLGFSPTKIKFPVHKISEKIIKSYHQTRDIPSNDQGTSKLGIHLRFGTISVRACARASYFDNPTWFSELMWREFFMQILFHFPHVEKGAFRSEYDKIKWANNKAQFKKWCDGKTGFPLVDAGMRELNETGHMHNRVRMVVASFLIKDLLIDYRWGERYFAQKLLDFDLAANNGNWQWAAGSGCDAAPYFRIFNPERQASRFDPDGVYIKKWIPEWGTSAYPDPMVDHSMVTSQTIDAYKKALGKI